MDTYIYKTREKALVHGISRAGIAQGQSARAGFWSGFISSAFATPAEYGMIKGTAITAAVSGTISEITGGKFANGAVSAAFVHLFNNMADPRLNGKGVPDSMGGDSSKDFVGARKLVANQLDKISDMGATIEAFGTVTKRPFLMRIGGMISVGATTLKILVSPKQYEAYEIYNEYVKPQYTVTPAY